MDFSGCARKNIRTGGNKNTEITRLSKNGALMIYNNIPAEIRDINSWVVWRYEDTVSPKPTKVPYNARTGRHASHSNPDTWSTYNEVITSLNSGLYDGIGFVLSDRDPYTFIDFDESDKPENCERHQSIANHFESYAEISPSGRGLHIIVKGSVPNGRKRNGVEVYSTLRYMTMTGNVYKDLPPVDYNEDVNKLWCEMQPPKTNNEWYYMGLEEAEYTDDEVVEMAAKASNGALFTTLWEGDWSKYPSQSEADFALIDIIAFYSKNKVQIKRLFKQSGLGARNKQTTVGGIGYIDHMLNRSFDNMLPPINIDSLTNQLRELIDKKKDDEIKKTTAKIYHEAVETTDAPDIIPTNNVYSLPPGLLGEIAEFIYEQAPRQVPEIALAGAIGCMSGIVGRAYNVKGAGLNQYTLMIADTGRGKSAMGSGIEKLFDSIIDIVPASQDFIGPGELVSLQGIAKYMCDKPSLLSVMGEFGKTMRQMCGRNTPANLEGIRKFMLQFYELSSHGRTYQPIVYSDKEKNTKPIKSPSFSFLGESTPDFYEMVDETLIVDGFLPRFTIIDYDGIRVAQNENAHNIRPSYELTERFANLCTYALSLNAENKVINVDLDNEAQHRFREFDLFCDDKINNCKNRIVSELWNRAGIKTIKLAALVAVGVNPINPVITTDCLLWASNIIIHSIEKFSKKFDAGDIAMGSEENAQMLKLVNCVSVYLTSPFSKIAKYCPGVSHLHKDMIVPYAYIQRRLAAIAVFRKDSRGSSLAIKRAINTMMERGDLQEMSRAETAKKYDTTSRCFVVKNPSVFGL